MNLEDLPLPRERRLMRSRTSFVPPPDPTECEFEIHGKQYKYTKESCGCFTPNSALRHFCLWLLHWKRWEPSILVLVLLNSIALGAYDYTDRENQGKYNTILFYLNLLFALLFTVEAALKIVAVGLFFHCNAFFRSGWNIIDFLIVISGFLLVVPQLHSIRVLRVILSLRPLKIASTSTAMKKVVIPWLYSVRQMGDVMLFLILGLMLFSIMGLYILPGDWFFRCRTTPAPVGDLWEIDRSITRLCDAYGYGDYSCPSERYCGDPDMYMLSLDKENITEMGEVYYGTVNYDNFLRSFLASFQILTFDSWADIMYKAQDSNNSIFARLFFPLLVFIGSFFCLNLIVGVIVEAFQTYRSELLEQTNAALPFKEEDNSHTSKPLNERLKMDDSQAELYNSNKEELPNTRQEFALNNELSIDIGNISVNIRDESSIKPENEIKSDNDTEYIFCDKKLSLKTFCKRLSENRFYKYIIVFLILSNLLSLALDRHNIDSKEVKILDYMDTVFFSLFSLEMVVHIVGTSFTSYLNDPFHIADLVLNVLGLVEILLTYSDWSLRYDVRGIIVILRTLRAIKLINKWAALSETLSFIWKSRMDILNFLILLGLFIFVFAIIGMELFANEVKFNDNDEKDLEHGESLRLNFDSIGYALLSAYTLQIGDNWTSYFFPYQRFSFAAYFYFIAAIIILNILLVNLFLAVLLEHFFCDEQKAQMAAEEKQNAEYDAKQRKLRKLQRGKTEYKHKVKAMLSLLHLYRVMLSYISKPKLESIVQMECKLEGNSLFLFSPENKLRKILQYIVCHFLFEYATYIMIIMNSIVLSFYTPLNDPDGSLINNAFIVDIISTCFFCIEIIMKIIVFGLIFNGPNSYLHNLFNILDIIATICMLISLLPSITMFSIQKIFFLFRVLRAIRLIYVYKGFRVRIKAMINGGKQILQALFIAILFILIFAIIGVHFFKGMFYYCDSNDTSNNYEVISVFDCMNYGGEWKSRDISFDNTLFASLTLFELFTGKSWCSMISYTPDFVDVDREPKRDHQPHNVWFTVSYMIIGFLCIRAILTGVISNTFFTQHERIQGLHELTFAQRKWVSLSKIIFKASPEKEYKSDCRLYSLYSFLMHPWVQAFFLIIVLLNGIILMLSFHRAPDGLKEFIDKSMYVIVIIYAIEAILKIAFYGKDYFYSWWNMFDFIMVLGLLIVSVWYIIDTEERSLILVYLTLFRVSKLLTLLSKTKVLKKIFQIVVLAIPSAATSAAMLLIIMYLFGVVGIFLFSGIKLQNTLNEHANFQNSWTAFLTLFRMSTADGWNDLMHDATRAETQYFNCVEYPTYDDIKTNGGEANGCGVLYAPVYFILVMIILTFMFLNVFIAIVVSSMMEISKLSESVLSDERLDNFLISWKKYDPDATGFIEYSLMWNLLSELGEPLGAPAIAMGNRFYAAITLWMLQLGLYRNVDNGRHYVTFYDVLEALVKKTIIKPQTLDKITNNESLENLKEGLKELWFQKTQLCMDDEQYSNNIEDLRAYYYAKAREGTNSKFSMIKVKLPLLVWIILKISKNLRRRAKERKIYGGKLRCEYEEEQFRQEKKEIDKTLSDDNLEIPYERPLIVEEEKKSVFEPKASLNSIEQNQSQDAQNGSEIANTFSSSPFNNFHNLPNDTHKTHKNTRKHNVPMNSLSKKTKI